MTDHSHQKHWGASFITPDWDEDITTSQPAPHLRHEFDIPGYVSSAELHITAVVVYRAEINGEPVGDEVLRPGWTS